MNENFRERYLGKRDDDIMAAIGGSFAALIFFSSLAYGIPVAVRAENVGDTHRHIRQTIARNLLAEELKGNQPLSNDRLGRFAGRVQQLLTAKDPVAALTTATSTTAQRDGIEDEIGLTVFDQSNMANNPASTDTIYFSNNFALWALEAHISPLSSVEEKPPAPVTFGLLRWQWLCEGEAGLLILMLLCMSAEGIARKTWPTRVEKRFLQGKSDYFLDCWRATVRAEQLYLANSNKERGAEYMACCKVLEDALAVENAAAAKPASQQPTAAELREILQERRRVLGVDDEKSE